MAISGGASQYSAKWENQAPYLYGTGGHLGTLSKAASRRARNRRLYRRGRGHEGPQSPRGVAGCAQHHSAIFLMRHPSGSRNQNQAHSGGTKSKAWHGKCGTASSYARSALGLTQKADGEASSSSNVA